MPSAPDRGRIGRSARRYALAAVFEADFGQRTADAILERHLAEREAEPRVATLAREFVADVMVHRDTIDEQITRAAPQYPVVQLARMDRALLRCALGEVLHSATPARVAIAEWVELARIYSGEPMRRLVNGVLGRIAAELSGTRSVPDDSSEEGVSGHDVRSPQEADRGTARRRGG